jgi:hypothetical protein
MGTNTSRDTTVGEKKKHVVRRMDALPEKERAARPFNVGERDSLHTAPEHDASSTLSLASLLYSKIIFIPSAVETIIYMQNVRPTHSKQSLIIRARSK